MTVCNLQLDSNKNNQVLTKLTPSSSTQNLAEITLTPQKSKIVDDVTEKVEEKEEKQEELRWKCAWTACTSQFKTYDELYDHVVPTHIQSKHTTDEPANADEMGDDEEPSFQCEWNNCGMELKKGENKKRIDWLEKHYRSRHAVSARPFKCVFEGCLVRASTSKQLEDHVRIKHINVKPKKVKIEPFYRRLPPIILAPIKHSTWVTFTINDMRTFAAENTLMIENEGKVRMEIIKPHNLVGAAKRKTGYTHPWRPKTRLILMDDKELEEREKKAEKPKEIVKFDALKESKIKLLDLFPNLRDPIVPQPEPLEPVPELEPVPKLEPESLEPVPELEQVPECEPLPELKPEIQQEAEVEVAAPKPMKTRKSMSPCPVLRPQTYHDERCDSSDPSTSEPPASVPQDALPESPPPPALSPPVVLQSSSSSSSLSKCEVEVPPILTSSRKSPSRRKTPKKSKRRSAEIVEETPSKKRARRSLPYGVFEEDSTDNEDAFGYERVPESILKGFTEDTPKEGPPAKKRVQIEIVDETSSSSSSASTSSSLSCKYKESEAMKHAKMQKMKADIRKMDQTRKRVRK